MKRTMMTAAVALVLAAPALADGHSGKFMNTPMSFEVLGSDFIGTRVYAVENDLAADYSHEAGTEKDWDDLGEVNDIVLTRDGDLKAVVIGVGGFIGIGEKDVAVKMDTLRFVQDGDDADDYFLVFTSNRAELENAPEWKSPEERMEAAEAAAERMEAAEEMNADVIKDENHGMRTASLANLDTMEREGYQPVPAEEISAETLIGARVYGTKDEDVGEVGDVILGDGTSVKEAIIDVGGLLGIGEKPVAVSMSDLRIMRGEDRDDLIVYIDASEERLEALPEYKG